MFEALNSITVYNASYEETKLLNIAVLSLIFAVRNPSACQTLEKMIVMVI